MCYLYLSVINVVVVFSTVDSLATSTEIPDTIPVSSSTDWQAAFGFTPTTTTTTTNHSAVENTNSHDDDLGQYY